MPAPADPAHPGTGPAGDGPADEDLTRDETGRPAWRGRWLIETAILLLATAVLSVWLRTYGCEVFWVPTSSMVPTIAVNDRILVQKAFFNWHDVHEGDIVVFTHPPLDQCLGAGDLVKRVIALPGQTIYSTGNSIYVNGHLLAEPYLPAVDPLGPPIASSKHPYRVPPGDLYVLGDNRGDSCDSRYWGPIQGSTVVGKAVLVIWRNNHPYLHGL